jgi:hypothetical protein
VELWSGGEEEVGVLMNEQMESLFFQLIRLSAIYRTLVYYSSEYIMSVRC